MTMVYILLRLKVADYARWHASFAAHAPWRMNVGERNFRVFRDADDPATVTVLQGWDDFATAQLYITSDNLRRMFDDAGIIGTPTSYIFNEVESGNP